MYCTAPLLSRLLFWLAYHLKHALLEDALNANVELRREVNALRRAAARRAWLDAVTESEARAVRILEATKPTGVPPLPTLTPYQARAPRPWELS